MTPLLPAVANRSEPLSLRVTEARTRDVVTRTLRLGSQSVYFRAAGAVLPPPLLTSDFAVLASVFTAMRLRRDLVVDGIVTKSLLGNLEEFQRAWHTWLPHQYQSIEIRARDEIEDPAPTVPTGIFAFSGGVDSAHTLLLHTTGSAGRRTLKAAGGVLIHGLDISLDNEQAFETAAASSKSMLDTVGIPLATVTTDWRPQLCHNWRMEHMAGIAAALNQFQGVANFAVVGSDEGYDKLDIPWGSNLVTNPFLGGGQMQLRTEGAGATRTEKVAFIAANSTMASRLRVCWEHSKTGLNCGTCEKCISTQLNFRACGLEPEGFTKTASLHRIALSPVRSKGDLYFMLEVQRAARKRGTGGGWRIAAAIAIARHILARPRLWIADAIKAHIRRNDALYRFARKVVKHV